MSFDRLWILHFLWVLPFAVLLLLFMARQKQRAMERFADEALLAILAPPVKKGRRFLKAVSLLAALGFMIVALAGPRWGSRYQEVQQKGVDIMVLVDVSPSMLVEDVPPNRLERAKREIHDFLKVVQGDRVGLVAFAGAAFVQCPLTLDYGALQMFLSALDPDLIPVPGTDLGAAIETGTSAFDPATETDKVMLLITDGEDNENHGLDAAGEAAEKHIKVFVFGIGDPSGGPVPATDGKGGFRKDAEGKLILSRLDEEGLKKIASATGGGYVQSMAGDLDLDLLYFDGIKRSTTAATVTSGKIKVYEERFPWFVLAAIVFLLLEGVILERKALFLFFLGAFLLTGGSAVCASESPDELYRQGKFEEAEKRYAQEDMDHPRDLRYRFNRGCAAYQKGDFQGATAAFTSVLRRTDDPGIRFKAAYNLGNAAFKQQDFESAAGFYRQAMLIRPESEDARYNLELSLREMDRLEKKKEEQQKQQQSQQEDQQGKEGEKGEKSKQDRQEDQKDKGEDSGDRADGKKEEKAEEPKAREDGKPGKEDDAGQTDRADSKEPKDLSGELSARQQDTGPDKGEEKEAQPQSAEMLDKKKAEALLDNIREDRSKFLRYQLQGKGQGPGSGKDW